MHNQCSKDRMPLLGIHNAKATYTVPLVFLKTILSQQGLTDTQSRPHRTKSHDFSQDHPLKNRFLTRILTWMFTCEVRFEMWLQSCTFYWRLKFLSYFQVFVVLFSYIQIFFQLPNVFLFYRSNYLLYVLFKFQMFVLHFFLSLTICWTFCSSPKNSSYFFFPKSNFYLNEPSGFP